MNNISAYIKGANPNFYSQQIDGVSTFTFAKSALLDERLDEAYLYLEQSGTQSFEPTTEIAILVQDENNNARTYYYVIASDRSQEQPNGSGKYKHEIHLIERTKILEGIYCSSLTFTNSKGNTYTSVRTPSVGMVTYTNTNSNLFTGNDNRAKARARVVKTCLEKYYNTPILVGSQVNAINDSGIITPGNVAYLIATALNESGEEIPTYTWKAHTLNGSQTLTVTKGNTIVGTYELGDGQEEMPTVTIGNEPVTLSYSVTLTNSDGVGSGYDNIVTMAFDFVVYGVSNRYPLKPWTITECVVRCLQLAEPVIQVDLEQEPTLRYTFNAEQAQKYANVYAPEFTMTQCTLREQLKVIGSYIHAEPRLGGVSNGVYYDNMIFFDEYGQGSKASIEDKPYIYKAFSHDINEYCTHIETSASNLVNALDYAQGVVTEPNINNNRTLRTESINVMLSEGNSFASTDNAIYHIPNQEGGVLVSLYNGALKEPTFEDIDITPFIFEETEYNNLSSFSGAYPYTKHYALYYTRGQKGIKGLFYKIENAYNNLFSNYAIVNIINSVTGGKYKDEIAKRFAQLAFKITYVPIYDTKFSHSKQTVKLGKKPFMRVYNQSENLIESRYYGENIKGVSQRMGNIEQTRTYIFDSIDDIPDVGQTIDGYFIVDVKCEFQQGFIKCTVQLSKDFNRISQYVGISSNKRVYEVSEVNAYARDILLKNYVVVGDSTDTTIANSYTPILNTLAPIMQMFNPNINGKVNAPLNAVRAYSFAKNDTNAQNPFGKVLLPVISSAFGNTMVFSWDYKDNYSAGTQVNVIAYDTDDKGNRAQATWQRDLPYGDYYGRAWWHRFGLYSYLDMIGGDHEYEQAQTVEDKVPDIAGSNETNIQIGEPYGMLLRKDNRERLSFNYEVEFVTTHDDIIIGSALASSCPLVTTRRSDAVPTVYFFKGNVGKFDKTLDYSKLYNVISAGPATANENGTLKINIPQSLEDNEVDFDGWAIVSPTVTKPYKFEDENGNVESGFVIEGGEILLARNKSKAQYGNATTETIKFQIANTIFDR